MPTTPSTIARALAWAVHFYTSLVLLCAAAMAVLVVRGDSASLRVAFVLMLAATVIDSTDGVLARLARVREVLPGFSGRRLDDLVDFLTYACVPLLLLWRANIPAGATWTLLFALLSLAHDPLFQAPVSMALMLAIGLGLKDAASPRT